MANTALLPTERDPRPRSSGRWTSTSEASSPWLERLGFDLLSVMIRYDKNSSPGRKAEGQWAEGSVQAASPLVGLEGSP